MKHHLQTWRHFHKLFHVVRFQRCIPFSMYECTRTGGSVCYCYMAAIHVSWTQRGFLWPHVSGINLSPLHSAFKFTDLYYPVIPSHSCQTLKNLEHWRCLAILWIASCCHWGLEGISQPLECSSLDHGNIQEQKIHTQLQTLMFKTWLSMPTCQSRQLCWHVFEYFPIHPISSSSS